MVRRIGLGLAVVYVLWIGLGVGHVLFATQHGCKQKGNTPHRCRHISTNGEHADHSHDGNSQIKQSASRWSIVWRQAKHSALFGFQDNDPASVPPECSCMISCFFSGDGLPSPSWPN